MGICSNDEIFGVYDKHMYSRRLLQLKLELHDQYGNIKRASSLLYGQLVDLCIDFSFRTVQCDRLLLGVKPLALNTDASALNPT